MQRTEKTGEHAMGHSPSMARLCCAARGLAGTAIAVMAGVLMAAPAMAAGPAAATSPATAASATAARTDTGFGWISSFSDLKGGHRSSLTPMHDRHGEPVAWMRTNLHSLQLDWVAVEDFSPALVSMILLSEDQDFVRHSGVDFTALVAALKLNVQSSKGGSKRGASTITMQLVGMLDAGLARDRVTHTRTMGQKFSQAGSALWLEKRWTKGQILEAYLNKVPLSGELVGIPAASRAMFGKAPHGLNLHESAILAALLRGPNAAPAVVARRACQLLKSPSCELMEGQVRIALSQARKPELGVKSVAGHYARYIARGGDKAEELRLAALGDSRPVDAKPIEAKPATQPASQAIAGAVTSPVRTTLDAGLQRFANAALQKHLRELSNRQVEDGAALVLDRVTGEVLAWVGSSGTLSEAAQVDFVLARRQAGSTLKPFLYAQAIEERRLSAVSLLDDRPVNLSTAAGLYVPRNYEAHYAGPVSARTALASSLNIPAVRVAVMLTPEKAFQNLNAFGFRLRESGGYFGYSLALGSAEVSLLELARAYRQLSLLDQSSGGITPASKYIVGDILSDNNARALTFGLDSPLATRGWAAVKTGTSKDMRDNWCIGFTDRFVVAVWVGNASGEPMHRVSGVTGAAPIWAELVKALHDKRVSQGPKPPTGVVAQEVLFEAGTTEPPRHDWFLAGTERGKVAVDNSTPGTARIVHPVSGTILALDPDIPPESQRLALRTSPSAQHLQWRVDGMPLIDTGRITRAALTRTKGSGSTAWWLPHPGRHWLSVHDAQGLMIDKVWVEVRGATEKPQNKSSRR